MFRDPLGSVTGKSRVQIWEESTATPQIPRSSRGDCGVCGMESHQLICCPRKGEHGGLKIWRGEALAEKQKLSEGRNYAFSTSRALGGCSSAELVRAELNGPDRRGRA